MILELVIARAQMKGGEGVGYEDKSQITKGLVGWG